MSRSSVSPRSAPPQAGRVPEPQPVALAGQRQLQAPADGGQDGLEHQVLLKFLAADAEPLVVDRAVPLLHARHHGAQGLAAAAHRRDAPLEFDQGEAGPLLHQLHDLARLGHQGRELRLPGRGQGGQGRDGGARRPHRTARHRGSAEGQEGEEGDAQGLHGEREHTAAG
ncbi:hypothetical protein [Deinococcus aerius]|uniref:hypothetical protein n=1 Tax=Deinococcus aerius TaxID=200253 RepID=UPI001F3EBC78|nr:hypothetical protein [Deinococcus aerius]